MKLAYFLSVHHLPRQFGWIFSAVYDPEDVFVIHIDERSPPSFRRDVEALTAGRPNIHFLTSIPVAWGGWNMCEIEFRAIRLLTGLNHHWDYLINLSGQDYPVQPIVRLREFLSNRNGESFIRVKPLAGEPFHFRRRLFFYCTERNGKLVRLPFPNWPFRPLKIAWFGSQWHFLSRDFCEWLVSGDMMARAERSLKHVKIPDEFFMQALAMNGPFRHRLNVEQWRYFRFDGPSPVILRAADYDDIVGSQAFFARKFDQDVDRAILERLAARISAPLPAEGY